VPRSGLWLRVFVGLLVAALPPIVLLVVTLLLSESVLRAAEPGLLAVLIVASTVGWAAILAIVFGRTLADDYRSLVSVARRGQSDDPGAGAAFQQLAGLLEERNRQVATLAEQASGVPIDDEPRAVVTAVVSAVRRVMGDPTWRCAVLASDAADQLPPGIYHGREDGREPEPIGELEQWASVSDGEGSARHVEGPWGAFAVIHLPVSERLRAILYAPWEGRLDPTPAEIDLLRLVGEHAGTALEHSLLYAQVRRQADELNRMSAIQADFLRGVTHDLQTPLTSIGALATELRAAGGLPEAARVDLDSIAHQAERLRRMVSQLLVASRLEAGVLEPQQEVFAVQPLVERTWAALRADRPFAIAVTGEPHLAVADPDRLEQVLWALFDNAVKYSPAGSPVHVEIAGRDGKIDVAVRDEGTGMDDRTRERAFDQFFRSDEARRLAPDGSGVGLYAARGLVEAMGGAMTISSRPGAGSSVRLTIPAEAAAGAE
jgi:signal transduction histidine kinase